MLRWLVCLLWGHKVVGLVETGKTYKVGPERAPTLRPLKENRVHEFCLRCGAPNPHYQGKRSQTPPARP